jgi:trigger factor
MELPQIMVDDEIESMMYDFENNLKRQNIDFETYSRYTGITPEGMRESNKAAAENRVRARLALESVAKAEGFEVTDEDFDEEATKMAEDYQTDKADVIRSLGEIGAKEVRKELLYNKALELVINNAEPL